MADFIELAAEAIDHVTDKHFDNGYDYVRGRFGKPIKVSKSTTVADNNPRPDDQRDSYRDEQQRNSAVGRRAQNVTTTPSPATPAPHKSHTLASSSSTAGPGAPRRYINQLPSPERERNFTDPASPDTRRDSRRPSSLERQSQTSERILRAYENEVDDPSRKVESVLPEYTHLKGTNRNRDMSYANGYGGDNASYAPSRPRSQQPPKSRHYDDDEGSDYDERNGRHYRSGGRGYDDDRDRDYDREIIETERYRGVSSSQALVVSLSTITCDDQIG